MTWVLVCVFFRLIKRSEEWERNSDFATTPCMRLTKLLFNLREMVMMPLGTGICSGENELSGGPGPSTAPTGSATLDLLRQRKSV
jgi:hypothetical protein